MGKNEKNFGVGSLVFARLKGCKFLYLCWLAPFFREISRKFNDNHKLLCFLDPPWPAKITNVEKKRFFVHFYGTGEKSPAMKIEDLYEYSKNKAQFVVDKNLKRKFYSDAVDQIEAALRGEEDVASINNSMEESLNPVDEDLAEISQSNDTTKETNETKDETHEMPELSPETPITTPTESNKKSKSKKSVVSPTVQVTELPKPPVIVKSSDTDASSEPEIVSRSGRKIKSKRYLIDEIEEPPTKMRRVPENDTKSPSKVSIPTKETPNPKKDALLQTESHLIELDHLIKASVGLKNADADQCLEHLNEYKTLKITPLMLKKRPGVVQTMKRLRRYVGNANNWEMDENTRADFEAKAHKIQLQAEEIYSSFKLMFPHNSDTNKSFWEYFSTKVQEFQEKTRGMTMHELNELYEEPPSPPTSPKNFNTETDKNNGNVTSV